MICWLQRLLKRLMAGIALKISKKIKLCKRTTKLFIRKTEKIMKLVSLCLTKTNICKMSYPEKR